MLQLSFQMKLDCLCEPMCNVKIQLEKDGRLADIQDVQMRIDFSWCIYLVQILDLIPSMQLSFFSFVYQKDKC